MKKAIWLFFDFLKVLPTTFTVFDPDKTKLNLSFIRVSNFSISITKEFYEVLASQSSFFNIIFLLSLFHDTISSLSAREDGYQHYARNIIIDISTILLENIISTHKKTFIKTTDFFCFNWLKKHSKVWDYKTQQIET